MTTLRHLFSAASLAFLAACASGTGASPASGPMPDARTTPTSAGGAVPIVATTWPVRTREHVDLWLHSFALLSTDSTLVPYFRRGYRDRIANLRRQRNATSLLDTNHDRLLQRVATKPSILTDGQFLPLYFESWDQMRTAIELTIRANGNPGAARDAASQSSIAVIAAAFPTPADREWLRLLAESVDDESRRFHHEYWSAQSAAHGRVVAHVDSAWQRQWRPALQRFLNNTQQQNGELYLAMPLGGEGRTVQFGKQQNAVAGPMPEALNETDVVLYVMAHEIVGSLAGAALRDNTTPAEQRAGGTSRYEQSAAVRAGALLLERALPAAVPGYMRFYLQQAGRTPPTDPASMFAATFTLPSAVRESIARQLDVVLGGI